MIVGQASAVFVDGTAKYCVCQRIAIGCHFHAPVDKGMGVLCCIDGIEHHGECAAGGIFHTGRHIETADCHTMVLIFHGAGTDCHIGENIFHIPPVFGIEHFIRGGQAGFLDGPDMHFTHGD